VPSCHQHQMMHSHARGYRRDRMNPPRCCAVSQARRLVTARSDPTSKRGAPAGAPRTSCDAYPCQGRWPLEGRIGTGWNAALQGRTAALGSELAGQACPLFQVGEKLVHLLASDLRKRAIEVRFRAPSPEHHIESRIMSGVLGPAIRHLRGPLWTHAPQLVCMRRVAGPYRARHWRWRKSTRPVWVWRPINRGSWAVDGSPRRGDCGSPLKWKRLTTWPLSATVKSAPSTVIS
jgi:hypothetical protein